VHHHIQKRSHDVQVLVTEVEVLPAIATPCDPPPQPTRSAPRCVFSTNFPSLSLDSAPLLGWKTCSGVRGASPSPYTHTLLVNPNDSLGHSSHPPLCSLSVHLFAFSLSHCPSICLSAPVHQSFFPSRLLSLTLCLSFSPLLSLPPSLSLSFYRF
jgi:hypothetical protein